MTTIGFVIVSHRDQAQLLRLVTALNRIYGDPPIACHHDFGQAPLSTDRFPPNVRFVKPSFSTGWAKWVVVDAALAALKLLYECGGPDWFVLMSAADYPVRSADEVLGELAASPYDAYLDVHPVDGATPAATLGCEPNPQLSYLGSEKFTRLKWSHYLGAEIWIPLIRKTPRWRLGRYTIHLPFAARNRLPKDFRLFFGDHWFTANRKCARILLDPAPVHLALQRHLRMRASPDEGYYHTVFCNTPGLSICRDNKRFADWSGYGPHPLDLTEAKLPDVLASGAHFARKFAPGSAALDRIDERLGVFASA